MLKLEPSSIRGTLCNSLQITRNCTDIYTYIRLLAILLALVVVSSLCATSAASAAQLGRFTCRVERIHGDDGLGALWANARLLYDADAGTLDGSFDPDGELGKAGILRAPKRLFSRLRIETGPWDRNNLTAVQYESADPPNVRPLVAWLMIKTLDNPSFPRFQFFSNNIRAVVTGKCVRD